QLHGAMDPDGVFAEYNESNNVATRTFGPLPTLDLVPLQVYFRDQPNDAGNVISNPCVGQVVYPHIQYQVTGTGSATGKLFRLDIDNVQYCTFNGTVNAGSIYVGSCSAWTVPIGNHTLKGTLDPDATINETNEGNNQATLSIVDCQVPDIFLSSNSVTVS